MYKFMTEEQLQISSIEDLKMLHLYQLGGNDALAVYYGVNKQINLCSMDANYHFLIQKIISLYSQCEHKDDIIIDEATKRLFDSAIDKNCHTSFFNRIGKAFLDKEGSISPKFASEGVLRDTMLPMIKYYLGQLFQMWNYGLTFEPDTYGWHRNCVLKAKRDGETLLFPIKCFFFPDNRCRISVGNFLKETCNIAFEVSYREDRLYIYFDSNEFALVGESHFACKENNVKAYTTIRVNDQVVYHMDEPVEQITVSHTDYASLTERKHLWEESEINWEHTMVYKLPWGGFLLSGAIITESDLQKRTDKDIIYLEEYREKISLRQFSHSLVENPADGLKLRTDGAVLRKLYYGRTTKEVETLFLPVGYYSGWDYKEFLENKYFYSEMEEEKQWQQKQ